MSEQFSQLLERAIGEYVRACVEFVLREGSAESVNSTGDALRKLIYDQRDELLNALNLILPLAKGYAPAGQTPEAKRTCNAWISAAEAAIAKATGLE